MTEQDLPYNKNKKVDLRIPDDLNQWVEEESAKYSLGTCITAIFMLGF